MSLRMVKKLCTQLLILLILTLGIPVYAESPAPPIEIELVLTAVYTRDLEAEIQAWLKSLETCESNGNERAINPMDTDGTESVGLYQFKYSTWKHYLKKYGMDSQTSIWEGKLQRQVVRRMVDDPDVRWGNEFPSCVKKLGIPPR